MTPITEITTKQLHHASLQKAMKLHNTFASEYVALSIFATLNEDDTKVARITVFHTAEREVQDGDEPDTTEDVTIVYQGEKVPNLADILDTCAEMELDPEAGAEEEKVYSGSVVAETYRTRYREASTTGRSCGDWLAEWLATQTIKGDDKTDMDELETIFEQNGIDMTAKWAKAKQTGTQGWQGRFRMNGRQVLEKLVAKAGYVLSANGSQYDVPEDELAKLQTKHAKWLAKEAKRDAAAAEVAEGFEQGEEQEA